MAERSKAPDSRLITFPALNGSGRSGLQMEAWVRIPLLTVSFCLLLFWLFALSKNKKLQSGSWKSIHLIEVIYFFFYSEMALSIGQVRYINILAWLRGFQDKFLYLGVFSLYPSLFWELRDQKGFKKL